ncbi:glutamyl-Q tRNA(Asp) synthetase [Pseudoxanthomonas japonensis]|uniref:tRNA glutamyl-Q(34) synthetase GluQRS n=1 Tax=Pseudoxanthomonas japonensis TaxID=69284 RepID=UPI001DCB6FA1|nr:tRNA glutamyl-Q(34) synthetase GluQRS [Pseudoxanthomonas japonensis]MBA3930063.1 tRNA glutamyl-Q(34) synthetase GluQRS [Xanthomonas sp.]MDR7068904.1 glutamyl-Q tRNA(Asp) synthetase [Pseudoxanthomonas japonensis]
MSDTVPSPYRGRFAPSPTGRLHIGSLVAALGSWLLARHHGGEWLIRVEDLDPPREVAGAAERQLATLVAFGLTSDEPVVWQSARHDLYGDALARLLASGDAFECRCSRSDLAASGGIHRHCVASDPARAPAIRLRVPDGTVVAFDDGLQGMVEQHIDREVGDVVLRRADGFWAYQLAVVVDDADQAITDVVRGADLLDSTPRQILLQRTLGLPTPRHLHLPLIVDAHGNKLSKSMASLPIDDDAPLPALRVAWQALGQPATVLDGAPTVTAALRLAIREFQPDRLPKVTSMTFAAAHNNPAAGAV